MRTSAPFAVERHLWFTNTELNRWEPLKSFATLKEAKDEARRLQETAERHGFGRSKSGGYITDYRVVPTNPADDISSAELTYCYARGYYDGRTPNPNNPAALHPELQEAYQQGFQKGLADLANLDRNEDSQ